MPIINQLLDRMNLEEILREHLPAEDARTKIATARGLMLLVKNILVSREPLYGVRVGSSQYAPDLLGLNSRQMSAVNDDSEVGAVMIVGGNIAGHTRVMTTAIALETSKGDLPLALALGLVLLSVVLALNLLIAALRWWSTHHHGGDTGRPAEARAAAGAANG